MKKRVALGSVARTSGSGVVDDLEPGAARSRTILYFSIILLLPFVSHFIAAYVLEIARMFAPGTASVLSANPWMATGIAYFALLLFTLFYLRMTLEPLSKYGLRWSNELLGTACAVGVGSGFAMLGIDLLFPGTYTVPPLTTLGLIGGLLTVAVLPAIFEETFFRGVIQTFYAKVTLRSVSVFRWQVPLAVFIASGFEVLFHLIFPVYYNFFGGSLLATLLQTTPQILYVAIFGAIGGYLYWRTKSLVAPIAVHLLGNATELVLLWLLS